MWLDGGLWLDCHMSKGASIETVCHSQSWRKLVEALDVNSTPTRGHVGYWMSVREHAYYSWKASIGLSYRKSSFSARLKEESWREKQLELEQLGSEPEVQFSSREYWTCIKEAVDSKHLVGRAIPSWKVAIFYCPWVSEEISNEILLKSSVRRKEVGGK